MRRVFNGSGLLRSTAFVALVLIALVLAVQYVGSWYALEIMKISKEEELERHLIDLGSVAAPQLAPALREILADQAEAGGEEDRTAASVALDDDVRAPFEALAARARLRSLRLLDPSGQTLLAAGAADANAPTFEFLDLDRAAFESALAGQAAGSVAYESKDSPLKRVYVPLDEAGGGPAEAVLCLTAGREYLGPLANLARSMRALSLLLTVSVVLIGWLVYRLLVTQRKFEERAAHADRLTSLGSLAAGFAHEVRNPLEIIAASAEDLEHTLGRAAAAPPEAAETCRDILEEVERLNRLVNQFLQYSRAEGKAPAAAFAPLGPAVSAAISMIRHAAEKRGVALEWQPGAELERAEAAIDEGHLRQIVLNLVMNALQATPEGGRVTAALEGDLRSLRFSVSDTGPGVPSGERSRIFDPFFTTRADGAGLGLSIAHQLAAAAGGRVECADPPSARGAHFILTLPRARAERTGAAAPAEGAARAAAH